MPQIQEARPPYITFEYQAEEDREASQKAGHYVSTDVAYVIITPAGSKDRINRKVSDWFPQLEQQMQEQRIPPEWVQSYKARYAAWKEGQTMPENGTSVRNWPVLSPAQTQTLIAAHVMTVEDLAVANEEVIMRLGMGGRALKQRAVDWLQAASTTGKTAEQLTALQVENEALKTANAKMDEQLTLLKTQVAALMAKA